MEALRDIDSIEESETETENNCDSSYMDSFLTLPNGILISSTYFRVYNFKYMSILISSTHFRVYNFKCMSILISSTYFRVYNFKCMSIIISSTYFRVYNFK